MSMWEVRQEDSKTGLQVMEALRKLTPEQVAKLPTRELVALAVKAKEG